MGEFDYDCGGDGSYDGWLGLRKKTVLLKVVAREDSGDHPRNYVRN